MPRQLSSSAPFRTDSRVDIALKFVAMIYREFEIEAFEIGRGQWHARFRRWDRAPTVIDGVEFEFLNIGFAWSSHDAAVADARGFIDRMQSRS